MGNFEKTALVIIDLQNDFLHPKGAYARGGKSSDAIAKLPQKIKPVANALRAAGGWVISTQFTLVSGKGGEPFISPHLKKLRPFLRKGDFASGEWGHHLVDELQPADMVVEKVAYSAFYQSRMEFCLKNAGIETLIICGIVTNGGVGSTLRSAHVRDFSTILLTDGCAAFSNEIHETAVKSLSAISQTATCEEMLKTIENG